METVKIGIACYEEMKTLTMRVGRGEQKIQPDDPKLWFTSVESLGKLISVEDKVQDSSEFPLDGSVDIPIAELGAFKHLIDQPDLYDDSDLIEHNPEFVR